MRPLIFAAVAGIFCLYGQIACAADIQRNDLTPGVYDPDLTKEIVCDPNWSTKSVRNVSAALKKEVYARYGLAGNHTGYCTGKQGCEVDHLISLELGGANDIENLWPQSYDTSPWNAHVKDRLENYLHKAVCDGSISLDDAQNEISGNWIMAYKKYLGNP